MTRLVFDAAGYVVSLGAERVTLLAKEFALLRFLYDNRNQAFTREQLLDRVWPMEYPVERTVDDHIYRLRKKLISCTSIRINTLRGYGYSLTLFLTEPQHLRPPSLQDDEIRQNVHGLLQKYQLLGQGNSLLALAAQQTKLGFEMDLKYQMYIHFVQADIAWFLEREDIPWEERLYWMLLLYMATAGVTSADLELCERVLARGLLSGECEREMRILNILEAYIENGHLQYAAGQLANTHEVMERDKLKNFAMPVALMEMCMLLAQNRLDEVKDLADQLEEMLQQTPYLRELGRYRILKGVLFLRLGQPEEAEMLMEQGMDILDMAGQKLLEIKAVCQVLSFLERFAANSRLEQKYRGRYIVLDQANGLSTYRPALKRWLNHKIDSV